MLHTTLKPFQGSVGQRRGGYKGQNPIWCWGAESRSVVSDYICVCVHVCVCVSEWQQRPIWWEFGAMLPTECITFQGKRFS